MIILEKDKKVKERHYLMARANGIDLKYFYIPKITIPDEYLDTLPYISENEELEINQIASRAFDYHHDRTEKNQAYRKKDREARIVERDSDPFYWLAIYLKAQSQLLVLLGQQYKKNGVVEIKKKNTINEKISVMNDALNQIKRCKVKVGEYPSVIAVQRDKFVEPNKGERDKEDKYLDFCKKYNILPQLVADIRVYTNGGEEITAGEIDRILAYNKKMISLYNQALKKCAETGKPISYFFNPDHRSVYADYHYRFNKFFNAKAMYDDSLATLRNYVEFINQRKLLRLYISRLKDEGSITKKEEEKLAELVGLTSEAYRELIMSDRYVVAFALSNQKEIETVEYATSIVSDENNYDEPVNGDDLLLSLHNQAKKIQSKIENAKRDKSAITERLAKIEQAKRELMEEEDNLTIQSNDIDANIDLLEKQYNDINLRIGKGK